MNIAVVCTNPSTGGWRVIKNLLIAMSKKENIYCFIDNCSFSGSSIMDLKKEFEKTNIKFIRINQFYSPIKHNTPNIFKIKCLNRWYNSLRKRIFKLKNKSNKNIFIYEKEKKYFDAVLFPWPYNILPEKFNCPLFFISHDLILLNHFGCSANNQKYSYTFYESLTHFAKIGYPITLSQFAKHQFLTYFPDTKDIKHIYWGPFSRHKSLKRKESYNIIKKFNIDSDYIIYPTNLCHHKNINIFLYIGYILRQRGYNIKCILTGYQTEQIYGCMTSEGVSNIYINSDYWDIKGLGLVSDEEIEALIKNAVCLVTTSLAEGACGPGTDAWMLGTPTVISDIKVFREYVYHYGIITEFANPYNAFEYADKIEKIIKNKKKYKYISKYNRNKMINYKWDKVADQYIDFIKSKIFEKK